MKPLVSTNTLALGCILPTFLLSKYGHRCPAALERRLKNRQHGTQHVVCRTLSAVSMSPKIPNAPTLLPEVRKRLRAGDTQTDDLCPIVRRIMKEPLPEVPAKSREKRVVSIRDMLMLVTFRLTKRFYANNDKQRRNDQDT